MRKDKLDNLKKILECLKEAEDWIWLRECARRTGLHHSTISRLLRDIEEFIDQQYIEALNIRMIKLKNKDLDINAILKVTEIKRRL